MSGTNERMYQLPSLVSENLYLIRAVQNMNEILSTVF
jgi:hypothetical protein